MPEIHLTQPGFAYSCLFNKKKARINIIKETGDSRYI